MELGRAAELHQLSVITEKEFNPYKVVPGLLAFACADPFVRNSLSSSPFSSSVKPCLTVPEGGPGDLAFCSTTCPHCGQCLALVLSTF